MSVCGLPYGSFRTVPLNLTDFRCRFACMFRGAPTLHGHHTDDSGSQRLLKPLFVLLSKHRIGDKFGSVV